MAKGSHDVIKHSALGVRYGDVCLFDFDGVTNDKTETVSDTYQMRHGKRSTYVDYCKELTATFANSKNNNRLTMVFRVYDNAVAFRYVKSVATGNKNVPLSCPATGTGVKRVAASLRLKSGKNRITLLQEEGKSMEIRKLQAGFICDGKKQ